MPFAKLDGRKGKVLLSLCFYWQEYREPISASFLNQYLRMSTAQADHLLSSMEREGLIIRTEKGTWEPLGERNRRGSSKHYKPTSRGVLLARFDVIEKGMDPSVIEYEPVFA